MSTASVGSYLFMRGWSLIFLGYHTEIVVWQTLYNKNEFETKWPFLVYTFIFLLAFIIFSVFQSIGGKDHA